MTTSIETSVLAAALSAAARHPVLFRQRLTITIKSAHEAETAAATRTAAVRGQYRRAQDRRRRHLGLGRAGRGGWGTNSCWTACPP